MAESQAQFEARLHRSIPITQHMGLKVTELTASAVTVEAPLENNRNVHDSGFAGSLYSICAVAAWSLLTHFLAENDVNATVVVRDATIQYKRPVNTDIVVRCEWPSLEPKIFLKQLSTQGKADVPFEIRMQNEGRDIVVFNTQMAAVSVKS